MAARALIYADESGIHEDAKVCLIGGYRGSPGQWKVFSKEWRAILAKPEYRIEAFHANVFFNRRIITNRAQNPYLKWSDKKAAAFIGELLMAIRRRRLRPVGCAVNVNDWSALSHSERCVLAGYITTPGRRKHLAHPQPYHLAFRVTLEDGAVGTDPNTELHYTFAEQDQYQSRAQECVNLGKRYSPSAWVKQFDDLSFASPKEHPELQAADLYARSWYNYFVRGLQLNRENFIVMNMLNSKRIDMIYCEAAGMERLFHNAGMTPEVRQVMRMRDEHIENLRKAMRDLGLKPSA